MLRGRYTWSDEAISELLRYVATQLHGSDADVTDTFSTEVLTATTVKSPAARTVWRREDYVNYLGDKPRGAHGVKLLGNAKSFAFRSLPADLE